MGIRRLRTLADECINANEQCDIQSTTLLFDGNNFLIQFIHYKCNGSLHLGGDYNTLRAKFEKFLQSLNSAGIKPYFLFDGVNPLPDVKWKTSCKRAREKVNTVRLCRMDKLRHPVLPLLTLKVFTELLSERKIPYCVTDFEADHVLCQLAHKWKCPLVSSDSDFLLMDLPGGVISVMDFCVESMQKITDEDGTQRWVIPSRVFRVEKFMAIFGIKDVKILPLLSVICGSDTFEGLPHILTKICKTKDCYRTAYLQAILKWLSQFQSLSNAREKLLKMMSLPVGKIREMDGAIESYLPGSAQCEALAFFEHNQIIHSQAHPDFGRLDEKFWFSHRLNLMMSKLPLSVICHSRRVFYCSMENLDSPSAWNSSAKVRKLIYKIVSKTFQGKIEVFQEWHRCDHSDRIVRDIITDLDRDHASLLDLHELQELTDIESRQRFINDLMDGDMSKSLVDLTQTAEFPDMDLLSAMIAHWLKNSTPRVSQCCLMACLICLLKFVLVDKLPEGHRARKSIEIHAEEAAKTQADEQQLRIGIIHSFAQYQTVIRDAGDLMALMNICSQIPTYQLFSGTFVYNLASVLAAQTRPLEYCQEVIVCSQPFKDIFTTWYNELRRFDKGRPVNGKSRQHRGARKPGRDRLSVEPDSTPNFTPLDKIPSAMKNNKFAVLME